MAGIGLSPVDIFDRTSALLCHEVNVPIKSWEFTLKGTIIFLIKQFLKLRHVSFFGSCTISWMTSGRHETNSRFSFFPLLLIASAFVLGHTDEANSQARVDLEDLSVKGELLNDNRMRMSSREATRVQDRVKYRKNFRPEITDGIDIRLPASESSVEVENK